MFMNMQENNRFKNYGLWVAVAALIGMVMQDLGLPITPEKYQGYIDAILWIAVLAGIINNPSKGKGYKEPK